MSDTLSVAWTVLSAVMSVIPNVPWWWFWAPLMAGWGAYAGACFIYIELMRGRNDAVLRRFANVFWIWNAALFAAFLLTRASVLELIGSLIVMVIFFALFFALVIRIRDRMLKHEKRWVRAIGIVLGVFLGALGFIPTDMVCNLTLGTLIFWRKPDLINEEQPTMWRKVTRGELMFTATLNRFYDDTGYRGIVSRAISDLWVNRVDPGHVG